jgi:hypothetical protein
MIKDTLKKDYSLLLIRVLGAYFTTIPIQMGAVMVSFFKYLPWQAMHFLQRSELNSGFNLEKVDWWNLIRTFTIQSRSRPMQFWAFQTMKREL